MNPEGMMDMLLTKNEAFKAVSQGMADWDVAGRPLSQSMWYEQQAICRAQVRKVYEYMRTHWVHARQLDYQAAHDNTVLLTIKSEDWQALREAVGGEE